jgi:hypothetical protein
MRPFRKYLMAAVLSAAALSFGCEAHYRVYDPYRGDYHHWGPDEETYYHTWVVENHRDSRDFKHLKPEEKRQYFEWRHNHDDHH